MTPSLWFICPAHGRSKLAQACLKQLARTCNTLTRNGINSSAVIIANDENLQIAQQHNLWTIERDNQQLGSKLNDGYQLAAQQAIDYVVPIGNDDLLDPTLILSAPLPPPNTIRACRHSAIVNETGTKLAPLRIPYHGGDGIRIIPTALLKPLRYRPANETNQRALDTSTLRQLQRHHPRLQITYHDQHPLQIIDWKTPGNQLNNYTDCLVFLHTDESTDPFGQLAPHYPADTLQQIANVYQQQQQVAA